MSNFHEMPFVRALLLALVVLFVVGAGMPGGALARVEMRNGHEGDPLDGSDIVSGGGGDESIDSENSLLTDTQKMNSFPDFRFFQLGYFNIVPMYLNGELIWVIKLSDLGRSIR